MKAWIVPDEFWFFILIFLAFHPCQECFRNFQACLLLNKRFILTRSGLQLIKSLWFCSRRTSSSTCIDKSYYSIVSNYSSNFICVLAFDNTVRCPSRGLMKLSGLAVAVRNTFVFSTGEGLSAVSINSSVKFFVGPFFKMWWYSISYFGIRS